MNAAPRAAVIGAGFGGLATAIRLQAAGVKTVVLEKPIKELGIYKVRIRLHAEVECEVKVWVVKGDSTQEMRKKAVEGDDE